MAQLNHFSLPCQLLTLPNQNVIAPQMMGEVNTSNTSEEVSPLTRGSLSSRTTQDDLDELEEIFLPQEVQEEVRVLDKMIDSE